ncbi:MAG: radical SAM protein [Nitrospinota bacterium]|mgnify:CR=1 FL=1|jgi:anaerobic magnesium-protoporphyrin IX monomethyl ester cyclase|nr:hypothetical protein [Nitrospinota bacterium]MDP7350222.1 radical SAM protein [Nitrospinota bacterium]MDP7556118.1 radical SAM protein [Nitrospinota bacterium]HJN02584.1 radical SAM protein [Nitrospinota bacterium]|tara:strand:- start:3666 stop:5069 length:1404 start_codon:yes stop_codon:yes gene_type:complete
MRILLAKPVNQKMKIIIPSMSLGYLASILKQQNHDVAYLDCIKEGFDQTDIKEWMQKNGPFDVVGCTVFSGDVYSANSMFKTAKKIWPDCHTTAGGPHPSAIPAHFLKNSPFLDTCFKGEAEIGLPMLLEAISRNDMNANLDNVPGLVWRNGEEIKSNEFGFIPELDDIPFPDWSLLCPESYPDSPHGTFTKRVPVAPIVSTRGCPFPCTYCAVSLVNGRKMRVRGIDNILDEIELLYNQFGIREIHFEDDNFTFSKKRTMEFCENLLKRKIDITWAVPNGVRLDTLDREALKLMEKSGCYSFAIGIESGSPKILKDMKRKVTLDVMEDRIRMIAENTNIRMTGYFIISYPTETLADINKTIDFSLKLPIHRADYHNFMPLPGTTSFNEILKNGEMKLESIDWDKIIILDTHYSPRGISQARTRFIVKTSFLKFYFRPRIILGLLKEINSWNQFKTVIKRAIQTFLY